MPTTNAWNNSVSDANVSFTGGTFDVGTDATDNAINIGSAANAGRALIIGNLTGTSSLTVRTGTSGCGITTTNGNFNVATGTGQINLGTDAAAHTVTVGNGTGATSVVLNCGTGALNLGTNAIARTTTLGNTTGASVLALKYGTGDFSLASATGNAIVAQNTGEVTLPLQPAFLARAASQTNVTGDGTNYNVTFTTELFDRNADYSSPNFTAPVTGIYEFGFQLYLGGLLSTHTQGFILLRTTSTDYFFESYNFGAILDSSAQLRIGQSFLVSLTAGDTATIFCGIFNGTKVIDIIAGVDSHFWGYLVC